MSINGTTITDRPTLNRRRHINLLPSISAICLLLIFTGNSPADASTTTKDPDPAKLPDFTVYKDVKAKKNAFFKYIYRLSTRVNSDIQRTAEELRSMKPPFDEAQIVRVFELADRYKVETNQRELDEILKDLRRRVRPVPPSLVMAQAANESAWGTSRFARKANNLFGQWCYRKGCGIVPKKRPPGTKHEVRKFSSPLESIASYMRNLNSGHAYKELRAIRAKNPDANGLQLADGLLRYSERRGDYVRDIKQMIRYNKLTAYDE